MYNWKDTRNYRRFRDENGNVIANIIYIDGEEVAVSDEVYEAYASMDRRERYLTDESDTPQDLSFERCVEDHVPFELLYENGRGSLEEDLERKEMLCILHKALQSIPAEEQEFIRELFFLHRTTRELAQKYLKERGIKKKDFLVDIITRALEEAEAAETVDPTDPVTETPLDDAEQASSQDEPEEQPEADET